MTAAVLDASAILAFALGEPGAELVSDVIDGSLVSAPNWAEVLTNADRATGDGAAAGELLRALGLRVEVVAEDDAELAAALARANPSLSLGDRFCLAVAERLALPAYTADRVWSDAVTKADVVLIR